MTVDGQLVTKAEFPWDFELKTRDSSDHRRFGHAAFSAATLRRHLAEAGDREYVVGYDIRVLEMPSMLSAQGTELGTVGFECFLQDPVGDAIQGRDEEEGARNGGDNFELLHSNPEELGLRLFDRAVIFPRLARISELYQASGKPLTYQQVTAKEGSDVLTSLFEDILTPPRIGPVSSDTKSLKAQIEALVNALRVEHLWYDFSKVNWRIRLGQIFWSDGADDVSRNPADSDEISDHDILLLQLLLACELLIRLDIIASMDVKTVQQEIHLVPEEVSNFRELETRKTRWDLVLARRFLENIEVRFTSSQNSPAFLPRNASQQLSGLLFFAKSLNWPDVENFESKITERLQCKQNLLSVPSPIPSLYATPLSSPRSGFSSSRNSYFESRPALGRSSSQLSVHLLSPSTLPADLSASIVAAASIGGWLSRSWLTGLVLPGEPISHFLISTLLENDPDAIRSLGDSATLYGGFIYRGRSFWSKHCIVAKVMACVPGSVECMGWISIPRIPEGFHEQWVDVEGKHLKTQDTPRITIQGAITRDSDLLGNKDADATVSPSELSMPKDSEQKPSTGLWFEGLRLQQTERNVFMSDDEDDSSNHRLYIASLHFSPSSISAEFGRVDLELQYNVHFVSAFPCTPPSLHKLRVLRRNGEGTKQDPVPGHPLHTSFEYRMLPAAEVLLRSFNYDPKSQQILVLDARGNSTLELFSRAWCASKGEDALVSRAGTTCIACSIREAQGLGINIIIRVG